MKANMHQAAFPHEVVMQEQGKDFNTWIVYGSKFELDKRYEILDPMG